MKDCCALARKKQRSSCLFLALLLHFWGNQKVEKDYNKGYEMKGLKASSNSPLTIDHTLHPLKPHPYRYLIGTLQVP